MSTTSEPLVEGIAIIGAVGRFPGASDLGQFWANLTAGVESVSVLTDAQLTESGFDPRQLRADPRYVPVRGIIERAEWFDAAFFGFTPREAQLTDPQHRLFLEAAWEALESAGCDPCAQQGCDRRVRGLRQQYVGASILRARPRRSRVGGVAGVGDRQREGLRRHPCRLQAQSAWPRRQCQHRLFDVTRRSVPGVSGAVDLPMRCRARRRRERSFPQSRGYYHDDEGISSPDGHTRAFDVDARGTVFSNGLGIVVLKRLGEALEDGDEILAVIRGAAVNNDGAGKASFTAPSADGQADVVALAQAMAGVSPDSVSYVETHGTATPIGDVIELAGLTKAFRLGTARTQFCAIGSVKSNIGHVEHAAGVAGLIKTALALQHRQIPPKPALHAAEPEAAAVVEPVLRQPFAARMEQSSTRRVAPESVPLASAERMPMWFSRRPLLVRLRVRLAPGTCCRCRRKPQPRWMAHRLRWPTFCDVTRNARWPTLLSRCSEDDRRSTFVVLWLRDVRRKPAPS